MRSCRDYRRIPADASVFNGYMISEKFNREKQAEACFLPLSCYIILFYVYNGKLRMCKNGEKSKEKTFVTAFYSGFYP